MNTIPFHLGPREGEIIEHYANYPNNFQGIVIVLYALGMKNALDEYPAKDIFNRWNNIIHEFEYTISYFRTAIGITLWIIPIEFNIL